MFASAVARGRNDYAYGHDPIAEVRSEAPRYQGVETLYNGLGKVIVAEEHRTL